MDEKLWNDHAIKLIKEDNITDLIKVMQEGKPDYLYKYVALGTKNDLSKLNCLQNSQLYFSRLSSFDDNEEYAGIDFKPKNKEGADIANNILKHTKLHDWACCLCGQTSTEPLLWVHYANCYRGFRLKFKVIDGQNIFKVIYTDERYKIKHINAYGENSADIKYNEMIFGLNRYTKKARWFGQNEYRIILDVGNMLQRPFTKHNYDYIQCGLCLEGIVVGCCCSEEDKTAIFEIAQKQNVTVEQCLSPSFNATTCRLFYERYKLTTGEINFIETAIKSAE